VQEFEGGNEPL